MRSTLASLKHGWKWWWGFGLLIAMPALALAILGLGAIRAERIEREQQLREQQTQAAHLADAAIANSIAELHGELRRAGDGPNEYILLRERDGEYDPALPGLILFSFNRSSGLVTFSRDKVYYGEQALSNYSSVEWPPGTEMLIEQARAAEAQRRAHEAMTLYRKIIRLEPKLRGWAELNLDRILYQSGNAQDERLLANPDLSRSENITPMGLPVALVACAYVEQLPEERRAQFIPLLEETIKSLRGGQWWLSYDGRRFYDAELRRLLQSAGSSLELAEDARLYELADIVAIARKLPPDNTAAHSFERSERGAFLMLWSPSSREAGAWIGLAVPQPSLAKLLDRAVAPMLSGRAFTAAIRDAQGNILWRGSSEVFQNGYISSNEYASSNEYISLTEAFRVVPGWEMAFGDQVDARWMSERQLIWLGFILLLVTTLIVGLAMTARVVRREMELGRLQNEFIAAVSHEFKSPLTSIRLLMERITSGRLGTPEAAKEYYAAIDRETERLDRLVHRLLEAQALQAGSKRYNLTRASIVEIAETAINRLQPHAEARGISLAAHAERDIPELSLDKAAMTDAIENLLDNAIKYSPSGTSVTVAIRAVDNQVCVDVRDEGIGIDGDDLPHIFNKFYRGRRGDRRDVKGAGLGLALVKAAIVAHGGSVIVTSTPGEGSNFSIRLSARVGDESNGARSDS